jgi:CRP-like cAMP-binding protein
MPLGMVLYESGDELHHIYFPIDSIVSLLYVLEDGASAEIAVVGNEGAIGVALFMGGETTPNRAIVQSAGFAYRLTSARLKDEFSRHGNMLHVLLRYTQSLITQMAQTAVCNRHHSLDQQLCRWLLLSLDRLSSNQLNMTQELIANMLGVRREGRHGRRRQAASAWRDQVRPGAYHRARPAKAGDAVVRVLRRGEKRNRSAAVTSCARLSAEPRDNHACAVERTVQTLRSYRQSISRSERPPCGLPIVGIISLHSRVSC